MGKKRAKGKLPKHIKQKVPLKSAGKSSIPSRSSLWAMILGLLTLIAYIPLFQNGYVNFDDPHLILNNRIAQEVKWYQFSEIFQYQLGTPHFKPLVYLSWIIEKGLFNLHPGVNHFLSLLIHFVSVLIVFKISTRCSEKMSISSQQSVLFGFGVAVLFAIHPMHVESVAWAVERKDILFGFFFLTGMYGYLRYLDEAKSKYLYLALLAYFGSLLSKSMGITLPAVLILLDLLYNRPIRKVWLEKVPFIILLLIFFFWVYNIPGYDLRTTTNEVVMGQESDVISNLAGLPSGYYKMVVGSLRSFFFLYHIIIPWPLTPVYIARDWMEPLGIAVHLAPLLVLASTILIWTKRKQYSFLFFGLFFFLITISPALLTSDRGTNFLPDRYTYIPSLGIFMMMAYLMVRCVRLPFSIKSIGTWLSGLYIMILMIITFHQVRIWKDSNSLWTYVIDRYKDRPPSKTVSLAYSSRGIFMLQEGEKQKSLSDLNRALETWPDNFRALINRSNLYAEEEPEKSLQDLNRILSIQPFHQPALNGRGLNYFKRKDYPKALEDFTTLIEKYPKYANAYVNRANIYVSKMQFDLALKDLDQYLVMKPNHAAIFNMRGAAHIQSNNIPQGISDISRAIQLEPNIHAYYTNRSLAYKRISKLDNALQDALKAKELGATKITEAYINSLK